MPASEDADHAAARAGEGVPELTAVGSRAGRGGRYREPRGDGIDAGGGAAHLGLPPADDVLLELIDHHASVRVAADQPVVEGPVPPAAGIGVGIVRKIDMPL